MPSQMNHQKLVVHGLALLTAGGDSTSMLLANTGSPVAFMTACWANCLA
jgi:hypothetical protein